MGRTTTLSGLLFVKGYCTTLYKFTFSHTQRDTLILEFTACIFMCGAIPYACIHVLLNLTNVHIPILTYTPIHTPFPPPTRILRHLKFIRCCQGYKFSSLLALDKSKQGWAERPHTWGGKAAVFLHHQQNVLTVCKRPHSVNWRLKITSLRATDTEFMLRECVLWASLGESVAITSLRTSLPL